MVVEVVAAFAANSLALLSDAGHMLTDVAGLAMALAAIHVADRAASDGQRTFGLYRLEILAALANSVLLFVVAVYVVVEAVRRWGDPPDVLVGPMLVVAILGLVANLAAFALLRVGLEGEPERRGRLPRGPVRPGGLGRGHPGRRGHRRHRLGLGRPGGRRGDRRVHPAPHVAARRPGRCASSCRRRRRGSTSPASRPTLRGLDGVVDVHDLHVWTLTSEMDVASVHLMVCEGTDTHAVLDRARVVMRDEHGIDHATLQIEPDTHKGCDELAW